MSLPFAIENLPFREFRDRIPRGTRKNDRQRSVRQVSTSSAVELVSTLPAQCTEPYMKTHQDPVQNEETSFISSQMPENSTPESDQFLNASVQTASVLFANQSAKT